MDSVWAPWRSNYINNTFSGDGCVFCDAVASVDQDRERLVLIRSSNSLIMLNRYPYTSAHLLVVATRHTAELDDLTDEELLDLMKGVRQAHSILRAAVKPDGYNVGINLGKVAGAGIDGHLHIHVVGRWTGDTNFMSVCGDVRVISEGLLDSYDRMYRALRDIP